MSRSLFSLLVWFFAAAIFASSAVAFETRAKSAFVIDQTTGTVLFSKNADEPLPPASMSKLMTLYVAFEAIRDGRLSLEERLPVSRHAMSYGGSTMFLDTTDRVSVEDLLRGIIVLSGNDACAVIAEALSPDGTEAGFARYMTQRAQQLGMTNSTFKNSNGWPADGHRMSMRDLALISGRIITDFPEFYKMFAEREFAFDNRAPQNVQNRNPLLGLGIGVDGLKTGHTQEAGYGLTGSAAQGNRRVIFVISGLETARARAEEAEAIVNWAFRQFAERQVLKAGEVLAEADVWMGDAPKVGLAARDDFTMVLPVLIGETVPAEIVYSGPFCVDKKSRWMSKEFHFCKESDNEPNGEGDTNSLEIKKGQELAELIIRPEGLEETRVPLVADRDVSPGGFMVRMKTVSGILLNRLTKGSEGAS